MRKSALIVICLAMLQSGCTSREDAENMLNVFVAMLNGGLVDDYDDYPGKSVEPDERAHGQRSEPQAPPAPADSAEPRRTGLPPKSSAAGPEAGDTGTSTVSLRNERSGPGTIGRDEWSGSGFRRAGPGEVNDGADGQSAGAGSPGTGGSPAGSGSPSEDPAAGSGSPSESPGSGSGSPGDTPGEEPGT